MIPAFRIAASRDVAKHCPSEIEALAVSEPLMSVPDDRAALEAAGVIFIEENGEGQGVRLRKKKGRGKG